MKSMITILTYNRVHALKECLDGLNKHCSRYPINIFDDCGNKDDTEKFLVGTPNSSAPIERRDDILATEHMGSHLGQNVRVFLGDRNAGVAGNSNRAIKLFEESDCDHLCLLNDDLTILGDFVDFYARAHADLGVGLFCFCDFTSETYRWMTVKSKGYSVKLLPRMTGIMMSITRDVVNKIGYFDSRFTQFGEEHVDYTIRARLSGMTPLNGVAQNCLDIESKPALLKHQEVETSVLGMDRQRADIEASAIMQQISREYSSTGHYRAFGINKPRTAGAYGRVGIPTANLKGYAHVTEVQAA